MMSHNNVDDIDNRFYNWKTSFPKNPINNNVINKLPDGWDDNSYHHDENPSLLWKVEDLDCCQLYFKDDSMSLYDFKDGSWREFSTRKLGDVIDLTKSIEWQLLRLRAFEHMFSLGIKNFDDVGDIMEKFCIEYLENKNLGSVANLYWPSEIVDEFQKMISVGDIS